LRTEIDTATFAKSVTKKTTTKKTATIDAAQLLIDSVIYGMEEVKANDITVMDLRKVGHASTDYFIICHANTGTQVKAISQSVEKESIQRANERPLHTEGAQNAKWILMDYGNVVVHIFDKEARSFYDIEELWGDAVVQRISA